MMVRSAAVTWKVKNVADENEYFEHLTSLVQDVVARGAELVVLPELHVLELLSLYPECPEESVPSLLSQYAERIEMRLRELAMQTGATVVGGSHFREASSGFLNTCCTALPSGVMSYQDKNLLTTYEREIWNLERGVGLRKPEPHLGVLVCYDCEFPDAALALSEADAWIICVPSWTETLHGFRRVRWSCQSRALENQVYVIQASLVGGFGRQPVPDSIGGSAIIAPSGDPFSEDEIIVETPLNVESAILADLHLDKIQHSRNAAETSNWQDRHASDWRLLRD